MTGKATAKLTRLDLDLTWKKPSEVFISADHEASDVVDWYVAEGAVAQQQNLFNAIVRRSTKIIHAPSHIPWREHSSMKRIVYAPTDIPWREHSPMNQPHILTDFSIVNPSDADIRRLVKKYGFLFWDRNAHKLHGYPLEDTASTVAPYYVEEVKRWVEFLNAFSTIIRAAKIIHFNEDPEKFKVHLLKIHAQQKREITIVAALPGIDTRSSESIIKHFKSNRDSVIDAAERLIWSMSHSARYRASYRASTSTSESELALIPEDLYSALVTRLEEIASGKRKIYICPVCERYYDHGHHSDRMYCAASCKQKAYRIRSEGGQPCNNGATTAPESGGGSRKRGRPKGSKKAL